MRLDIMDIQYQFLNKIPPTIRSDIIMPTIEIDDDTKERLKNFKKRYEEKYGKTTWEEFMVIQLDEILIY